MVRLRRLVGAAVLATTAVAVSPSPASAAPLAGQWWFDAWEIDTEIWPQGVTGEGITVAVVESGVEPIPDLEGVLLPGVDLVDGSTDGQHDFEDSGHGTGMAALIASHGGGTGLLGIAPGVQILPVTIDHGEGQSLVGDGIRWAVNHDADVINLSIAADASAFPDHCPAYIQAAVEYAVRNGAVVVAGAGNEGHADNLPMSPAACEGVVAVGAIDRNAQPWIRSQRQPYVDVAAPGVDTVVVNQFGQLVVGGGGTSDATALTSGAIALVWSAYPELTNRQVVARILATLRDQPPNGQKDPQRGYGTVLPQAAIREDVPLDAPNPIFDELELDEPGDGGPDLFPDDSPSDPGAGDEETDAAGGGGGGDGGSDLAVPLIVVGVGAGVLAFVILGVVMSRRRRPTAPVGYPPPWQSGPGP